MRYYLDFDSVLYDSKAQRLFVDAATFLREKENATTIVVSGSRSEHEPHVRTALEGIPRMSVMYTDGVRTGEYLKPHPHLHVDAILVDGRPEELAEISETCPGLQVYEIRRDGEAGDGRWSVVRLLSELP